MTRIIAGTHRGRRLQVPTGERTRPTADRAREGLFSSLQSLVDLEGAEVLDLYAGSGAVGLEALSRGAARAVLVESDPAAAAVIRQNCADLGLPGDVRAQDVAAFLAGPAPAGGGADVAFLDPPYADDVATDLAAVVSHVRPGGIVVVERATRGAPPEWPEGLDPMRSRRYGEATLHYAERS